MELTMSELSEKDRKALQEAGLLPATENPTTDQKED